MSSSTWKKRLQAAGAALLAALLSCVAAAQTVQTQSHGGRWVATWTSAPIVPGPTTIDAIFGSDHSHSFDNQTVRHIAHTSVGGRRVRVRLSNVFGMMPLRIGAVSVALSRGGAAINPHSNRRLTFGGRSSITIPAGAVVISDAEEFHVPPATDLAVSLYVPGQTEPATFHETTMQHSYMTADGSGNFVNAADLPGATVTQSTFYLTVVEVLPSESIGALVAFGDSLTQGAGSEVNENQTWPELLSLRLNQWRPRLSVVNQGVGCGRLLHDFCGPGGSARFDRDVLAVKGVTHVIIGLGLNDIQLPPILANFGHPEFLPEMVSADEIIAGLQQLVERARAEDLRVYGATISPNGSSTLPGAFTPENEAKRQAVNHWIRTSGVFDGVVDVDAVVRHPEFPWRLQDAFNADGIHLTNEGYQAVANSINLSMFF